MTVKLKSYEWLEIERDGIYPFDPDETNTRWRVLLPFLTTDQVEEIVEANCLMQVNSREEGPRQAEVEYEDISKHFLNKSYVTIAPGDLALYRHDEMWQLIMKVQS